MCSTAPWPVLIECRRAGSDCAGGGPRSSPVVDWPQSRTIAAMQQLSIRRPDDFHLHLRSGAALATTVKHAVRQCARAIVMPNLAPEPVTTVAHARRYRDEIMAHVQGARFQPLMTLYLTDETTVDQIREAAASGIVFACTSKPSLVLGSSHAR